MHIARPAAPERSGPGTDQRSVVERVGQLLADLVGPGTADLRVGVDVCEVTWFRDRLQSAAAPRFLSNTFTAAELAYCADRPERLAARWAAKEAVAKAIGTGFRGLRPSQIEICRQPDGAPTVRAADHAAWPMRAHTWSWAVSLTHDGDLAVAVAVAIAAPRPVLSMPSTVDAEGSCDGRR